MKIEPGSYPLSSGTLSLPLFVEDSGHLGVGKKTPFLEDIHCDFPLIFSSFGSVDFREMSLLVVDERGYGSRRFLPKEIKEGKPIEDALPHPYGESKITEIVYEDDSGDLRVHQFIKSYEENAFSFSLQIENIGNKDLWIRRAFSFEYPLEGKGYEIISFPGRWGAERNASKTTLSQGEFLQQSICGISSSFANPMLLIAKEDVCYGMSLVYSGNHKEIVSVSHLGSTKILIGMNDFLLNIPLKPKEIFATPEAIFTYGKSVDDVQANFSSFTRKHILRRLSPRPVVYNTWEGSEYDIGANKWKVLAQKASQIGCDVFLFDDGWYYGRTSDKTHLGDWRLDSKRLGATFDEINEYLSSLHLKLGLWIEPEMASLDADIVKNNPSFILRREGAEPLLCRNQVVLDLANDQVISYLKKELSYLFLSSRVAYVKWDFNRLLTDVESSHCLGGEYFHRFILGYYELLSYLRKVFPEIIFEGCASGGARFDLGCLCYLDCIWTSDNTDPYDRLNIQEGTSLGYPLACISNHYSASPNVNTRRQASQLSRATVALFGPFGVECNLLHCREEELLYLKQVIAFYKEHQEDLLVGDYHLLLPVEDKEHYGWLVKKEGTMYVLLASRDGSKVDIDLPYIDPKKEYKITPFLEEGFFLMGKDINKRLSLKQDKAMQVAFYVVEEKQ